MQQLDDTGCVVARHVFHRSYVAKARRSITVQYTLWFLVEIGLSHSGLGDYMVAV